MLLVFLRLLIRINDYIDPIRIIPKERQIDQL